MSRLDQLPTRPHPPENSPLAVLRLAQKHKTSRAPMLNPYDTFTQPDFDAWIGDMTGTLRRALGYEEEEHRLPEKTHVSGAANGSSLVYHQLDHSDLNEVPDNSFLQIKTRRDKGKARDPREGPGLGRDRTQAIEVISSDEEEEEEVKGLAFSLRDDEPDVYDQNEYAESDDLLEGSSPTHILSSPSATIGPPGRSRRESNIESDDGDDDEYDDDDGNFVKQANDSSEVITIISDGTI
jgi:hypothetical protein